VITRVRAARQVRKVLAPAAAVLLLSAALLAITPLTASAETYWVEPAGDLTVFGRGFGHGRGMSQYGAQGAALAGKTSSYILDFYYPGTTSTTVPATTTIRVRITADTTPYVAVLPATGLKARIAGTENARMLPVATSITQWAIRPHGEHATQVYYYSTTSKSWTLWWTVDGMTEFTGAAVTKLVLPDGSAVPYRGTLRAADRDGTDLDTLNVLSGDYYLRGVVPKEALTSWKPAALQAQAVAARTYAISRRNAAIKAGRDYDLCDTQHCQVYWGYAAEAASTNDAVVATANQVRTYNGKPILAEFSSSNGGYTAPGPVPYQVAKADPYDDYPHNGNPYASWTRSVDRATAQSRLGVGIIKLMTVLQRNGYGTWGGRLESLRATGTTTTKDFTGDQLRLLLGLRSTWVRFDQSQIMKRWVAIGGLNSPVGGSQGYEWPVRGGSGQAFAKGHIYRTTAHGAWEIYGGFESRYQSIGGPSHAIGLPIAAKFNGAKTGSQVQRFGSGRMFWSPATGVREVYGRIYVAYYNVGLEGGRLGLPTSYQYPVSFGAQQVFQGGYINWYSATDTTAVVYR